MTVIGSDIQCTGYKVQGTVLVTKVSECLFGHGPHLSMMKVPERHKKHKQKFYFETDTKHVWPIRDTYLHTLTTHDTMNDEHCMCQPASLNDYLVVCLVECLPRPIFSHITSKNLKTSLMSSSTMPFFTRNV